MLWQTMRSPTTQRFFFRPNESDDVTILDGDRIAIVCALFLNELLSASGLTDLKLGVVQTA